MVCSSSPDPFAVLDLPTETATRDLAEALAPTLRAGDVIGLRGEIGAGKSTFARAAIAARLAAVGRAEDIPSPTYTLVQSYDAGDLEIWHADLYRLTEPDEARELGLDLAFETSACLVEWPERLAAALPDTALSLHLTVSPEPTGRRAALATKTGDWPRRLAAAGLITALQPRDA